MRQWCTMFFAAFVRRKGLTNKHLIKVSTSAGKMTLKIEANDDVTVNMGEPIWHPNKIPFRANAEEKTYILRVGETTLFVGAVSLGNPHCVTVVEDINGTNVAEIGALVESHERFPERVNVGFMQVVSRSHIRLRVYERGAGETQACGRACAAVAVGIRQGLLDEKVMVDLLGWAFKRAVERCWAAVDDDRSCDTSFEGQIQL